MRRLTLSPSRVRAISVLRMSAELPASHSASPSLRTATTDPAPGSPAFDSVLDPTGGGAGGTRATGTGTGAPAQPGRGKVLGWVIGIALAVVVGVGAYAVFGGASDDDDAAKAGGPQTASIARGSADAAALRVEGSVGSVLMSADAADDLLVGAEATGADAAATVLEGDEAVAALTGDASTVRLAPGVAWTLDLAAETDAVTANLTGASVSGVTVTTGARSIDLTLPAPEGDVTIDLQAGLGNFNLHVPAGVAVVVDVVAGAGQVMVDDRTENAVEAGTQIPTEGFAEGDPHYRVTVSSGVGTIMVHHDAA
ncbi:hypothetical protein CPER28S_01142 [Cellulomonas persica]|uniref:Uncharacterized protein n=2 Tax=Cellulomonas persica TaxID=76861 RepID=A0A510UTV0_9CELL|nr:hypothetical protein CPE01_18460 [Cellulomonas persica]